MSGGEMTILFIVMGNNDLYCEECVKYINEISVPESHNINVVRVIGDENRISESDYEEIEKIDSKYKIFLSEKVYIFNENFLIDLIKIFHQNDKIGMIGLNNKTDADSNASTVSSCLFAVKDIGDGVAKSFSGNLTVCDNYISKTQQSGYTVVIAGEEATWCYCNREALYGEGCKMQESEELNRICQSLITLVERGAYEELKPLEYDIGIHRDQSKIIDFLLMLLEIYELEEMSNSKNHSEWLYLKNWNSIQDMYLMSRQLILRIVYKNSTGQRMQLAKIMDKGLLTKDALYVIAAPIDNAVENLTDFLWELQDEPLVSVMIPVYNGADFVGETIESVLRQDYPNMEIIIVDDASTDNSREVLESYHDERLRYIWLEKNQNVCNAANCGFREAKGKYILALGHDDLWKEDKISKQVEFMEGHPACGACFTRVDIIDEEGRGIKEQSFDLYKRFNVSNCCQESWIKRMMEYGNCICAPSMCLRKEMLEKTGLYRYGLVQLQDYDLWLRFLKLSPIYILSGKYVFYRQFSKIGRNLSSINEKTIARVHNESHWIVYRYIMDMPDEFYNKVWSDVILEEKGMDLNSKRFEKRVLCAKAMRLQDLENDYTKSLFMELLDDEECREIFERFYGIDLQKFYEMNAVM